jgi:hypothetical protein
MNGAQSPAGSRDNMMLVMRVEVRMSSLIRAKADTVEMVGGIGGGVDTAAVGGTVDEHVRLRPPSQHGKNRRCGPGFHCSSPSTWQSCPLIGKTATFLGDRVHESMGKGPRTTAFQRDDLA